jgi:S-adenosylmethionine-dependent methyltransferase
MPQAHEIWTANAERLGDAYIRSAGYIRFEVVTRYLQPILAQPARVIDVGGGYGLQARLLCERGHHVTVVDIDRRMLDHAAEMLTEHASRSALLHCSGHEAALRLGASFDLVCCHSMLMYQQDLEQALGDLVALVKPGGWISILSINPSSEAMRSGLQEKWAEAVAILNDSKPATSSYLDTIDYSVEEISDSLSRQGIEVVRWEGVGVFTDHLQTAIRVEDPEDVYLTETLAGQRDPYRQIARCFHLLARKPIACRPEN